MIRLASWVTRGPQNQMPMPPKVNVRIHNHAGVIFRKVINHRIGNRLVMHICVMGMQQWQWRIPQRSNQQQPSQKVKPLLDKIRWFSPSLQRDFLLPSPRNNVPHILASSIKSVLVIGFGARDIGIRPGVDLLTTHLREMS